MHVLVAPLEFKGTLSAREAAEAIAEGLGQAHPRWTCELLPLADGGPGTVDVVLTALPAAQQAHALVEDPLGRAVRARFAIAPLQAGSGERTAFLELAEAGGLHRLAPSERAPLTASTFGVGQLIRAALDAGCAHVVLGLGGSATNDCGAGALQALGVRLVDFAGAELPRGGAALSQLVHIDAAGRDPRLQRLELATDVQAPLLGSLGASRLFGPQKGATEQDVERLEAALAHFASLSPQLSAQTPGAGAAGGAGFGLAAWLGGRLRSGFELLAQVLNLNAAVARADLVITGEGHFDRQSLLGKGPAQIALSARDQQTRAVLIAGRIDDGLPLSSLFDRHISAPGPESPEQARGALIRAAASL